MVWGPYCAISRFSGIDSRSMQQSERLGAILERLSADGSVSVAEIAASLDVSAATIRRDLRLLEGQRLLGRTHGGAVPQGVLYELPLRYKSARQPQEKLRIAREAAFARICELPDVDELITDLGADADAIAAIEDAGVRVTTV